MVKIARYFAYIFFFFAIVLFFIPKVELYYMGEKQLAPLKVIISDEELTDNGFSLEIKNAKLFFEGIESVQIEEIKIAPWGFYNNITIQNVKLSSAAKSFLPLDITSVELRHVIYNPVEISINAEGDFGKLEGSINIYNQSAMIFLIPSAKMQKEYAHSLRYFKKEQDGRYSYAKNF